MRRHLSLLTAVLLLTCAHTAAGGEAPKVRPATVGNTGEWKVNVLPDEDLIRRFTQGAELTLVRESRGEPVSILVHSRPQAAVPRTPAEWRNALFGPRPIRMSVLRERVLSRHGQQRFLIEYQRDTDTESMLQIALMATVVGGRLYLFTYSNYHNIYESNVASVRDVLTTLTVTAPVKRSS